MKTKTCCRKDSYKYFLFLFIHVWLLAVLQAYAQEPKWYLLVREQGCADLDLLVAKEKLPRRPSSPDDFVKMMRERGHKVSVGYLPDRPPEMVGRVVEVKMDNGRAPVFVREEVCGMIEKDQ